MDFDSHTGGVLAAAVEAINLLTPGQARGRAYTPEPDDAAVLDVLNASTWSEETAIPDGELPRFAEYAAALRRVFEDIDAGRLDEACTRVNELLARTEAVPVLAKHDGEPWHLHFHALDAPWARSWAASMATSLAVVLGNPAYDRLGVCRADACDRVYVDTSRNGTRRFCCLACQNRVKAAAFRRRGSDRGQ